MAPLELWAGVEATVNRVGEAYQDQLALSGFERRPGDLDLLASLGAKRIRFPVLWERAAPKEGVFDWHWLDGWLGRARALGLAPIAGLLHHGSGPAYTDLLDPDFPQKLARYARAVARRYPWLDAYTPVNEPLTTARFSALYGHWYPHRRRDGSFVRALLNQVRATQLAMRAVREVNPAAQLVQTEDLGFTHATPGLRVQADFDNARRWLSFDLLTGRVDERHELWDYLRWAGAGEWELAELAQGSCPPDVLGVNAYVTSERFLDDRLTRYPAHLHGGNGRDAYVDVEAVRVLGAGVGGFGARLREAHGRYGLPLALTEVHLGCTREEQLRWLWETWQTALDARADGVDVRALTVWSAFGAYDWNSLLTQRSGHYEPGLWDVRAPKPRPTALVTLARELAGGRAPSHPVLEGPGWWRCGRRFLYPPEGEVRAEGARGRPLLIVGEGALAAAFARICEVRGLPYRRQARSGLAHAELACVLDGTQPWAVVNADWQGATWKGAAGVAAACAEAGIKLVHFSSGAVFGAQQEASYVESDAPDPPGAHGRGQLEAERAALRLGPQALVVRTSSPFGPWNADDLVTRGLAGLRAGRRWTAPDDRVVSPTYLPELAHRTLDLLIDGERGVWHLTHPAALSWADFARLAARMAGLNAELVTGAPSAGPNVSPGDVALASERGWMMPGLERALEYYLHDLRVEEGVKAGI